LPTLPIVGHFGTSVVGRPDNIRLPSSLWHRNPSIEQFRNGTEAYLSAERAALRRLFVLQSTVYKRYSSFFLRLNYYYSNSSCGPISLAANQFRYVFRPVITRVTDLTVLGVADFEATYVPSRSAPGRNVSSIPCRCQRLHDALRSPVYRPFTHQHRITHEQVPARRVGGRKDAGTRPNTERTAAVCFSWLEIVCSVA